jgi:putative ABC transport system ATP-binding protein
VLCHIDQERCAQGFPVALLSLTDVGKEYRLGATIVPALRGVSFDVGAGTFVTVMGPSGSGKSTLMHLIGGLDHPTSGSLVFDGADIAGLGDGELTLLRRRRIGFVFQFFNLLPTMTAWENVALPRVLDGLRLADVRPKAVALLERVGLAARVEHKPAQLSGGEMQRVAIARALVADPTLLLADEPTGNLDSHSGQAVLDLLRATVDEDGRTVVMVTHDARAASIGDRVLTLEDGRLVGDSAQLGQA